MGRSPAPLPRQPWEGLGWRSWQPQQLGATTHVSPFDLAMSPGGFPVQIAPAARIIGDGGPHPVFL